MQFVRNCWYVAGWSSEFGRELVYQEILEDRVVFYRKESGDVVALQDRCPHKLLPLSKGQLLGDTVQCGYHGLTFDCGGKCVRVPGQDNLPENARVRAYPVHEQNDIVWIWMGDPELADVERIFTMPQLSDPSWNSHQGDALHIESNYLNVADNLCDPAHVAFVHPTTLGNPESEDVPIDARRDGDVIVTWRWIRNAPPVGLFKSVAGFTGNVDRWHYYYLYSPSIAVIDFGSADVADGLTEERRAEGTQIFALHFLTPKNATNTVDRWMHTRNFATDEDGLGDRMNDLFRTAFDEDKEILEAIQIEELKCRDHRPVKIAIDKGANMYRRIVSDMIDREQTLQS